PRPVAAARLRRCPRVRNGRRVTPRTSIAVAPASPEERGRLDGSCVYGSRACSCKRRSCGLVDEAMALTTKTRVELQPIQEGDGRKVADFLNRHLNGNVSADAWARALDVPWTVAQPNAGFMLTAGDEVVGANIAFYSERVIDGRAERFCNLGAWCVLDDH